VSLLTTIEKDIAALAKRILNSTAAWAASIKFCIDECAEFLPEGEIAGVVVCLACFGKLALIARELNAPRPIINEIVHIGSQLQALQLSQGGSIMALASLTTPPVCATRGPQHKGICCAALTQLGATVAASGFQYTSCSGRTVCMKCGVGTSTSVKHPGRAIFIPRRVQCGPSGCPALSQA